MIFSETIKNYYFFTGDDSNLGWKVDPSPTLSASEAEATSRLSREDLLRDLLKKQPREIHVEDFLWTGSGTSIFLIPPSK